MPAVDIPRGPGRCPPVSDDTNSAGVKFDTNNEAVRFRSKANHYEVAAKGGWQMREVSIAAAAVATLRATPVTLVAAPGAGNVLVFHQAALILDWVTPAFTESADNLAVKYTDGSGLAVSETIEATGFIDQSADTLTFALPDAGAATAIATKAQSENKALVLHNTGDGEFGGAGGSALRVKVWYSVVPSGW